MSKIVNHFCHLSVLYAENLPSELADGMLGNKAYQEQHAGLRLEKILHEFRRARRIPASSWYSFARTLMEMGKLEEAETGLRAIGGLEVILRLLRESPGDFDEIWDRTRVRVEDYKDRFEAIWSPKSDEILSSLSSLAKREWVADEIRVHFVDCLWGGFAWIDSVAFTPFPDMEVQKKFLAHELSELITPRSLVEGRLLESGLDAEIAHTVVDMIAYFSVKDFIAKPVFPHPERRGIRPNPNYYPAVEELYPLFEQYAKDPSAYTDFDALVEDIVRKLESIEPTVEA